MCAVRIMMSLQGDSNVDEISAYLANERVNVLGFEQLTDEGATISRDANARETVEPSGSSLRALWIIDASSRAVAVELAKNAPGEAATLEVRESYTPQDFGAPPDPNPPAPAPAPAPARKAGTHRYIAFIRTHHEASLPVPTLESTAPMEAYCAPLVDTNTMIGGEGLKPSSKATRVRRRAAQRLVLDGPFTESKELVGGYMIVQVPTLDEAIEVIRPWLRIHSEIVGVAEAAIEVRKLVG
jgi:hypothetical protein